MQTKQEIRQTILSRRKSLSPEFISDCETRIFQQILEFQSGRLFSGVSVVMGYSHFKNEVPTDQIREFCFRNHLNYCLPVTGKAPEMDAFLIDRQSPLRPDAFGVPTPDPGLSKRVSPEEIQLIFVPGLAFDPAGNRLGFGKGYYDHFLKAAKNAVTVALAYNFQVVEQLFPSSWDIPVDYIATEKGILSCKVSEGI